MDLALTTQPAPELCVVVPVLNEQGNVAALVDKLRAALAGIEWEVVFVDDDSRDGTRAAVAAIGAQDRRVRLVHRVGRGGLASAFVEGVQASLAPYVAAIDGDLQHDEALLPAMLGLLRAGEADIVVGSRYVLGGDLGEWGARRAGMSSLATRLSRAALRTTVQDPMSGFFMLPRAVYDQAARQLSAIGFKILLDLIASLPAPPRVRELPYRFRPRVAGESKLDAGVMLDFALLLADKTVGHLLPVRFVLFAMVGATGLLAHLTVLRGALMSGASFSTAQGIATACAIAGNYVLNNEFTFRDQKLRGARFWRGLAIFSAVCSVGAVANIGISALLLNAQHEMWWVAGLAGAAMSLVWNYAAGSTLTWRRR